MEYYSKTKMLLSSNNNYITKLTLLNIVKIIDKIIIISKIHYSLLIHISNEHEKIITCRYLYCAI